jgi:hypothetical protein
MDRFETLGNGRESVMENEKVIIKGRPYVTTETRTGVPLSYVAEKLRHCLETLHSLIVECGSERENDEVSHAGTTAFRNALKSYLALKNSPMLGDDQETLRQRLLATTSEGFRVWLDCVDRRDQRDQRKALDRPAPEKTPTPDSV